MLFWKRFSWLVRYRFRRSLFQRRSDELNFDNKTVTQIAANFKFIKDHISYKVLEMILYHFSIF